jgi:hypothetical protein
MLSGDTQYIHVTTKGKAAFDSLDADALDIHLELLEALISWGGTNIEARYLVDYLIDADRERRAWERLGARGGARWPRLERDPRCPAE